MLWITTYSNKLWEEKLKLEKEEIWKSHIIKKKVHF